MESSNGNTDSSAGLVAADRGSASVDRQRLSLGDLAASIEARLDSAGEVLAYGRRQESELAIEILAEIAEDFAAFKARAIGQG